MGSIRVGFEIDRLFKERQVMDKRFPFPKDRDEAKKNQEAAKAKEREDAKKGPQHDVSGRKPDARDNYKNNRK